MVLFSALAISTASHGFTSGISSRLRLKEAAACQMQRWGKLGGFNTRAWSLMRTACLFHFLFGLNRASRRCGFRCVAWIACAFSRALPEAHGYAAKESIEHVIWETYTWFDKYVKNAAK